MIRSCNVYIRCGDSAKRGLETHFSTYKPLVSEPYKDAIFVIRNSPLTSASQMKVVSRPIHGLNLGVLSEKRVRQC